MNDEPEAFALKTFWCEEETKTGLKTKLFPCSCRLRSSSIEVIEVIETVEIVRVFNDV